MIPPLLRRILGSALGRYAVAECTLRALEGAVLLEVLEDAVIFWLVFGLQLKFRYPAYSGASLAMVLVSWVSAPDRKSKLAFRRD